MSTDYTITDPTDALYDGDVNHPAVNERFEWQIRNGSEEYKKFHRRLRRERQELAARHAREVREFVEAQRRVETVALGDAGMLSVPAVR